MKRTAADRRRHDARTAWLREMNRIEGDVILAAREARVAIWMSLLDERREHLGRRA